MPPLWSQHSGPRTGLPPGSTPFPPHGADGPTRCVGVPVPRPQADCILRASGAAESHRVASRLPRLPCTLSAGGRQPSRSQGRLQVVVQHRWAPGIRVGQDPGGACSEHLQETWDSGKQSRPRSHVGFQGAGRPSPRLLLTCGPSDTLPSGGAHTPPAETHRRWTSPTECC